MRPSQIAEVIGAAQNLYIRQRNIEECAQFIIDYLLMITEAQAVILRHHHGTTPNKTLYASKKSFSLINNRFYTHYFYKKNTVVFPLLPESEKKTTLTIEGSATDSDQMYALISPLISTLNFMLHTEETVRLLSLQSQIDGLTQTYTKEYFKNTIQALIKNASANPFCLLMLDINQFKGINDRYGHWAGDQVLIQFCQRLRKTLPNGALIARLGGDEFGILLPSVTNTAEAEKFAQAITTATQLNPHERNQLIPCHTAIGVVLYPEGGLNYQTLYQQADHALYESKRLKRPYVLAPSLQQRYNHKV